MENLLLLTEALEFIEENLTENIKTEDIAANLYCSKSKIEKLFKYVTRISIRNYIIRRRMSLAAKEISSSKGDIKSLIPINEISIEAGICPDAAGLPCFTLHQNMECRMVYGIKG